MVVLTAACGPDSRNGADARTVDAPSDASTDAPVDAAGSGSAAAIAMEASPHDLNLELMVVALGMIIAVGPVRGSQRRRDTL
ncbi:MAG: hypothetical protein JWO36_4942 [Myxococcales bacterium]|nr:hypothetical protein [Myxococcales bacterium]